jgi:hypothetical protein
MRPRTLIPAVCSLLAMLSLAYAADVNGKWTAQVPGRNGETRETTFTLKAEGGQLTATTCRSRSFVVLTGTRLRFSSKERSPAMKSSSRAPERAGTNHRRNLQPSGRNNRLNLMSDAQTKESDALPRRSPLSPERILIGRRRLDTPANC